MARPKLDDELADAIRELHQEVTGEKARSLEEALQTVVAIAAQSDGDNNRNPRLLENWYVGKNAEAVYDRIKRHVSDDAGGSTEQRSVPSAPTPAQDQDTPSQPASSDLAREVSEMLVFKGKVSSNQTVEIPEAELEAFGVEKGAYLQFYAKPISPDSQREQGDKE
jgi:hypothetical protein